MPRVRSARPTWPDATPGACANGSARTTSCRPRWCTRRSRTVVEKDRSMEAMIKNDEEKVWMTPLLELRNELDKPDDRDRRDFRRMTGRVQLMGERVIPGPYTKE